MKNLNQIRAFNSLKEISGGVNDGEVVKKIPSMIMNNGLLAAAAFAVETGKGYQEVFEQAIIPHLADKTIGLLSKTMDLNAFIKFVSEADSQTLRLITAETMAYLEFLRRLNKRK